jgi:hypothetical protein
MPRMGFEPTIPGYTYGLHTYCGVQTRYWAETSKRTRSTAVAIQQVDKQTLIPRLRLDKHVTAATDPHAAVEVLLHYNNGNGVFYVVRAEML